MLHREIIAVCSQTHTNTLGGQKVDLLNVRTSSVTTAQRIQQLVSTEKKKKKKKITPKKKEKKN